MVESHKNGERYLILRAQAIYVPNTIHNKTEFYAAYFFVIKNESNSGSCVSNVRKNRLPTIYHRNDVP